jgi:hypothetical protein
MQQKSQQGFMPGRIIAEGRNRELVIDAAPHSDLQLARADIDPHEVLDCKLSSLDFFHNHPQDWD